MLNSFIGLKSQFLVSVLCVENGTELGRGWKRNPGDADMKQSGQSKENKVEIY